MDFSNKKLWLLFSWGGTDVYVTESLRNSWVLMAIIIAAAIVLRIYISSFKSVPKGIQNVLEMAVEAIENLTVSMMGPGTGGFGAYFFGIFTYILLSNLSALFGVRPPTADLAFTAGMGLCTFIMIHFFGIVKGRKKYFKDYLQPVPLFLPLNIISELVLPVSLSFRLFGNVLGGMIIMGIIYELLPVALKILLPSVLHGYFDLFAGVLQAFIFTVLSMTYIGQKFVTSDGQVNTD